jgi:hypothetical protein
MRPRFQSDADFNRKIVLGLRRREPAVDILSAHEGGVIGVPDPEVLTIAAESARVLVSHESEDDARLFHEVPSGTIESGVIIVSPAPRHRRCHRRSVVDLGSHGCRGMGRTNRFRAGLSRLPAVQTA